MARAVTVVGDLIGLSGHVLSPGGRFVLQKGIFPQAELAQIKRAYRVEQVVVPSLDGQRHVIIIDGE